MSENSNAILLVGNGINQAFEDSKDAFIPQKENWDFKGMSWENIVKQIIFNCNPDLKYDDVEKLPATLQIVTASKDNVKEAMKSLSECMVTDKISEDKADLFKQLLDLPIENILTTNYSYELEQAAGIPARKYNYYQCRRDSEEVSKTLHKLRLYTYSDLSDVKKKIWHIHGDAATPDSVVMGHYYYGKLLREIQIRIKNFMPYCKGCMNHGIGFESKSWVDLFLTKDVYIVGFGFDFSEMDLWWLAACKKEEFANTKIHYYEPKGKIGTGKRALLDAYNIEIHEDLEVKDKDYISYYTSVIRRIEEKLGEGELK